MVRMPARRLALASTAAFALLLLATPAQAHHKPGHEGGPPTRSGSVVTEDSDGDGSPNTPDPAGDSDNKHSSGKDKTGERGNQGNSQSDPDGDSNGGADKPGGTGGIDQLDQDGNNGCGNDDDFEDDNNGNCGGKNQSDSSGGTSGTGAVAVLAGTGPVGPAGVPGSDEAPLTLAGESAAGPATAAPVVVVEADELAFTGANAWILFVLFAGLVLFGVALVIAGRRRGALEAVERGSGI